MDSKKMVMEKSGAKKLGKKTQIVAYQKDDKGKNVEVHNDIGEIAVLYVKRKIGDMGYVLGRRNEDNQKYGIIYDPETHLGQIDSIVCGHEIIIDEASFTK